jgi:cation diffusion facilitator CzcD-associated flavoprotein CzcO
MASERPLRFAIIGAGMSGILSGIKLQEAGFADCACPTRSVCDRMWHGDFVA